MDGCNFCSFGNPYARRTRGVVVACGLVFFACAVRSSGVPEVTSAHTYPKRSNDDAALLEWGSSAIIHNADGVVARFGPSATHPEFVLGIEAELVTASPRQGCEPLSNARAAATQIVVMHRGGCDFGTKARHAARAGAAALIVVNSDRRSPDRAFAMSETATGETPSSDKKKTARGGGVTSSSSRSDGMVEEDAAPDDDDDEIKRLPSVMISYAAGQQLREHAPRRMRLFAGGGRPFIESVADAEPVLYLVHNAATESEMRAAKDALAPLLQPAARDPETVERAHRVLGALRGRALNALYERVASIVGYPVEHLGDLALEKRTPLSSSSSSSRDAHDYASSSSSNAKFKRQIVNDLGAVRDDRRLSRFNAETGDDARAKTVMTVYIYLDDVEPDDDGSLYFVRARPAPVRVAPAKGLAAVWYSAMEDGALDRSAAHADGALHNTNNTPCYVLHLRVYAQPRPLARRLLLPLLLIPFGGAPAKTLVLACKRFFARSVGEPKAEAAVDAALWALAAVVLAPLALLAFVLFKLVEQARAKPVPSSVTKKHHVVSGGGADASSSKHAGNKPPKKHHAAPADGAASSSTTAAPSAASSGGTGPSAAAGKRKPPGASKRAS